MILYRGKEYPSSMQDELIRSLPDDICETLTNKTLPRETVVSAIDRIGKKVAAGEYDGLISSLPVDGAMRYKELAIKMLSREYIEFKIKTELGSDFCDEYVTVPPQGLKSIRKRAMPLGVILHIAAGNVDGLPAFSLAEGLITGNINILKLPQADNGLSLSIIKAMIKQEPEISDFVYVFDTPSSDVAAIKKLADLSDGICVWGSEAAVAAVRRFAQTGTKLIEWGHKLSFAYVSGYEDKGNELAALAKHIVATKQLLCSSCQTIFIDTDDMNGVYSFCRDFFPVLQTEAAKTVPDTVGGRAEFTLKTLTERLDAVISDKPKPQFADALCSLIPCEDSELELSPMFNNVLIKRLPQRDIIPVLRRKKGYLQTAGLICEADKRERLCALLAQSGVVRVTKAGNMSGVFAGEAHDGEYPLRRYMRIVDEEI